MPTVEETRKFSVYDPIAYVFDEDVPVQDFFDCVDLNEPDDFDESFDILLYYLEERFFLRWEAVLRDEQGLPLSARQQRLLRTLKKTETEADGRIFYIEGQPRPTAPWYVTANLLAPGLLIDPYPAAEVLNQTQAEGWARLLGSLDEYGKELSLPAGVRSPLEVFPPELAHRLNLQLCFSELAGLGQDAKLSLKHAEMQERLEWFIEALRQYLKSVAFLQLTLERMLERLIIPAKEKKLLADILTERLQLPSGQVPLVDYLGRKK